MGIEYMTVMPKSFAMRISSVLALLALCACGRNVGGANADALTAARADSQDSSTNTVQSMVSSINQSAALAESVGGVAPSGLNAFSGTCPSSRSVCMVNTRTVSYADCSLGRYSVNGSANLNYDSAATCATASTTRPISGSVTRTTAGLVLTVPNNAGVLQVTSNSATAYNGEAVGGGARVSFNGANTYSIAILGLNRTRYANDGLRIFDHSVKTASDLQVSGSFAGRDRMMSSGSVVLHHNRLQFTATTVVNSLLWNDLGCCHPRRGTMTSTLRNLTGATLETWTIDFGVAGLNCGQVRADITKDGIAQTSTLTLPDCE